jgi:hypothetical protein
MGMFPMRSNMKEIVNNPELVAFCGLYCGACGRHLKGKCPGCADNSRARWCKVRSCCKDHQYSSCAECGEFSDPRDCKYFNNIISKIFGLIFRSDRAACIDQIKAIGIQRHAKKMTELKAQSLKK